MKRSKPYPPDAHHSPLPLLSPSAQKSKPFPRVRLKFVKSSRGRPQRHPARRFFAILSFSLASRRRKRERERERKRERDSHGTRLRRRSLCGPGISYTRIMPLPGSRQHHETVTRETGPASNAHDPAFVGVGSVLAPWSWPFCRFPHR